MDSKSLNSVAPRKISTLGYCEIDMHQVILYKAKQEGLHLGLMIVANLDWFELGERITGATILP